MTDTLERKRFETATSWGLHPDDDAEQIDEILSHDVEGRTEFNLREAIAESIRVCGREYTKEIVNAELEHG